MRRHVRLRNEIGFIVVQSVVRVRIHSRKLYADSSIIGRTHVFVAKKSSLQAALFWVTCCDKSSKNSSENSDFMLQGPALLIEIRSFVLSCRIGIVCAYGRVIRTDKEP